MLEIPGLALADDGVVALSDKGQMAASNAGVVPRRIGLGATPAMSAVFLGGGLACIPLALRLPAVPVLSVTYLLMSVENGLWNVAMITLRQSYTPHRMFGRMWPHSGRWPGELSR